MIINSCVPEDEEYLARLSAIAVKPKMLYYYGKMPERDERFLTVAPRYCFESPGRAKTVAVVGARKNTEYGKEQAYKIAYELAKHGVVIVSGLAFGIDSVAHRAALDAGGITLAVLGTPIDQIYPASHTGLADEIVQKGGAIISEYPEWSEVKKDEKLLQFFQSRSGRKASFLTRNRLISGLADVVVIVEADLRSGSLNTAHHAFEQSNLVYVVPGDVGRASSRGCNRLLGRGAVALTDVEDILLDLGIDEKKRVKEKNVELSGDTEIETLILKELKDGVRDGEEILASINRGALSDNACPTMGQASTMTVNVSEFAVAIFELQMKNRIKSMGSNRWMLVT